MKLLLAHGYEPRAPNGTGLTALHCAVISGCHETAELLVQADPGCVDICDMTGAIPLHFAAASGQERILRLLLGLGASSSKDLDSWL